MIRAAAQRAIARASAGELEPLVVDRPTSIEVDYVKALQADFAAIVPGAERIGDRGVRHLGEDPVAAYRGFLAGFRLAGIVD
jgi:D-aminopeptidase